MNKTNQETNPVLNEETVKEILRNHEHTTTLLNEPTKAKIMLYRSSKGYMVMQFNGMSTEEQSKLKAFMELVAVHGLDVVAWYDNNKGLPFEEKRISWRT